ncbi:YeiH family protein [Botrimarina hoheduenensis]|uniref:Sulfate exporter family transporter n=1 Tax=Botrimarina hoheduenensis TaxID=2528000 RepID=A0A5C5W8Q1_9BACT|nr:putative sulfate exporter family transporter [Botrimarina hoheduenensis]TWT46401.1 hypothetical protein Pla111_14970 [Botrimarina hoheduenensis]
MELETPGQRGRLTEDWLAILLGGALLAVCLAAVALEYQRTFAPQQPKPASIANPLKPYLATPGGWANSPLEAFSGVGVGIVGAGLVLLVVFTIGNSLSGGAAVRRFLPGFAALFTLATLAMLLSEQAVVDYYGLAYAVWAIALGLIVANLFGTPGWLRPALRTELFVKTGLVLYGAEVLIGKLLALGLPGICIAWIVTPVVLIMTYWFGQRVLRIESRTLNMVVSADMSVCGVSAAIATAAACKAKREELSVAIGLSLAFTALMMVVMPPVSRLMGLNEVVAGAWIGGTIDSTGAVGVAGAALGDTALLVAATIKMIQNCLIGVVAFGVATYWTTVVERDPAASTRITFAGAAAEIWRRFPKFLFGFLGASLFFSALAAWHPEGEPLVASTISGATKTLRTWCFCISFTSIGLESDFRELSRHLRGGKPLVLYVCGQGLNLVLTLLMALLVFEVLFPGAADALAK